MKKKYYWKWLKYYLKIDSSLDIFYFQTINLLEKLNCSIYLEHSISIKSNNNSKFRWLICLVNLSISDFKFISFYINSLSNFNINKILNKVCELRDKKIQYSDIIIWFDYINIDSRIKFYYTTENTLLLNWSIFNKLVFKNIIKWYDICFNKKEIISKEYIVLNKIEIYNNRREIINILWNRIFLLLKYVDWLNIALKNNGDFISLDFKFNWNKDFISLIQIEYGLNINNLDINLNKTSFISIKYDINKKALDINNYNLYFYG